MAKCIYRDGRLLTADELLDAPTYVGSFLLEDESAVEGASTVRQARLVDIENVDIVAPLEAAEIIGVGHHQMMVCGHQFNTESYLSLPHRQCWLLRPTGSR